MDILEDSYWNRQHQIAIEGEKQKRDSLQKSLESYTLDEATATELEEKERLEMLVKTTTNAKRRDAQRLLDRWKDFHTGPKWTLAQQTNATIKSIKKDLESTESSLKSMEAFHGNAEEWLAVLETAGFIADGQLTKKGILATECNENHTILASEFYTRGHTKDLSGHELLTAMACFIDEKETDATPSLSAMNVPKSVKDVLYALDDITQEMLRIESDKNVYSRESFWKLSTTWIEPMWRWLAGENIAVLCAEYGIFEGNFVRAVLRIANMADEWTAIATFCEDIELLEKLKNIRAELVRDVIVPDSLYLHI